MKNDSLDTSFEFTNPSGQERALRVFDENSIEVNMPLPDLFGPGTLTTIMSRPDIGIMIIKHDKSPDSVRVETRIAKPMLKIGFALQAASCSVWLEGSPARLPVSFGNLCIASPSAVIQFEDAPSRDFDFLTLTMGPDFVLELIEEYGDRPSPEFERLVLEPRGEPSLIVSSFGAEARSIAERIRHCAFGGSVQRLYVEGATLELAAISLQRLLRIEDLAASRKAFSERDEQRMREAGEVLDARFVHPPSIGELAKELGLSQAKLKRDFKRAHGMAVHEYIITRKMDYARKRIAEEGLSVKEASYLCGYKSQSHFTQAFARRYGYTPGSDGA
jgi:AraC-like DNA-binding protein